MGWTTAINDNWDYMITETGNAGGEIYDRAVLQSNTEDCSYDNYGIRDAVLYQATGNSTYANRAWDAIGQSGATVKIGSHCVSIGGTVITCAGRNKTRDSFVEIALVYSLAGNGMSAENKSSIENLLDAYVIKAQTDDSAHGTRTSDTDELIGHFFGMVIYALAIRADDQTQSDNILESDPSGWVVPTGNASASNALVATEWSSNTLRNAVYKYFSKWGLGGEWLESSQYNMNTLRYALVAVHAINDFCSGDGYCDGTEFAEMTSLYDDIAETYYQKLTPDYKQHFQWGDVQTSELRQHADFKAMSLYSVIAFLDSDVNMWDIVEEIDDGGCFNGNYFLFYDPTAARTEDSGQTDWNSNGMGMGYWHEDWGDTDTFYASKLRPVHYVHHDWDALANFNVYKNGKWIINNPKWYYGNHYEDSPYMNHVLLYGAFTGMKEARGQTAWEGGSEYMYHSGISSGYFHPPGYDAPTPPFIDEYTRQLLFVHTDGDEDIVFLHDRIDACKPSSSDCISSQWYYASRMPQKYIDRSSASGTKHHWVIHVDETATNNGGGNFQWTTLDNNEMYLQTYIPSYTAINVDMSAEGSYQSPYYFAGEGGGPPGTSEDMDQLRLAVTADGDYEFHDFLNVLYTDGSATLTEITEEVGSTEDTHGVMIDTDSQWIVVLFNATDVETQDPPLFTSGPVNYAATYDPGRFTKTKKLSHFQSDSEVKFTTTNGDNIDVYILGLDTTKAWTVTADAGVRGESVSADGVMMFTLSGASQEHTVDWTSSPYACDANDWRGCVVGDCVSTGWYWYDGSCHEQDEPEDLCIADWVYCTEQAPCESADWCWQNADCIEECIDDPGQSEETTVYATADTYIDSENDQTILYNEDFNTGTDVYGVMDFSENGNANASIDESTFATPVMKMTLDRRLDTNVYRTEVYNNDLGYAGVYFNGTDPAKYILGETYYFQIKTYLPAAWVNDSTAEIILQFHQVPNIGGDWLSPITALMIQDTSYTFVVRADTRELATDPVQITDQYDLGSITADKGNWVTWLLRVKFDYDDDGEITLWKDGDKVIETIGKGNAYNRPLGPYHKFGVYKWPWNPTDGQFEDPTETDNRTIYFDDLSVSVDYKNYGGLKVESNISSGGSIAIGDNCKAGCDDCGSLTTECTVSSCSDQVMIASVSREETGDTEPNSVTWNGDAMTKVVGDGYFGQGEIIQYYILNPDVGTHDLVATFDGGSSIDIVLGMVTLCNAKQQAAEASCSGGADINSCDITTQSTGAMLISSGGSVQNTTWAIDAGEDLDTEVYEKSPPSWGMDSVMGYGDTQTAGSYTCGWTNGLTGDRSGVVCSSWEPTGGGGSNTYKSTLLRFDLSDLDTGININNVELKMTVNASSSGVQGDVWAYKGLRAFNETQATWDIYSTGNSWTTAGGKANGSDMTGVWSDGTGAIASYSVGGAEIDTDLIKFTPLGFETYVQDNIGGTINIILHGQEISGGADIGFYDVDDATETNRPYLLINYTPSEEDQGYIPPDDPVQLQDRVWCGVFCGVLSN